MVTPRKIRAIGRYLENLNPKINEIIRILEAEYGGLDENGEDDEAGNGIPGGLAYAMADDLVRFRPGPDESHGRLRGAALAPVAAVRRAGCVSGRVA